MIVTAHQPNYLPGRNVLDKVRAADAVIWLDEVQYTKGGWTNRNQLPSGSWLTVPVERATDGLPINRVKIAANGRWRERHVRALRESFGGWRHVEAVCAEVERPYGLLVGLTLACLRVALPHGPAWLFQSHLDGGHAVQAVSDDRTELAPISERLAMMVGEVGGDVYLSGPSGRNYLDEAPFAARDIRVAYWKHAGPSGCWLG